MKNKERNLLIVAKKYNDIYYALSLSEWQQCRKKTLLIVTKKLSQANYPMQELFDEVYCVQSYDGSLGIFQTLIELKRLLPRIIFDTVILSNISIVANKYILINPKCKQAILVEDGYMNYYDFKEPDNMRKRLLMNLFGIKQESVVSKIKKTYLLKPECAEYFFGDKCSLKIDTNLFASKLVSIPNLQRKKIFIGQPLYHNYTGNSITVEQYNQEINSVIKKFDIDYYVPHTMADPNEKINCEVFDVGVYKCTFEVLASMFDLTFYSVSSTVLYSSKLVNPKCRSVMVQIPNVDKLPSDNILYKFSDEVVAL